MINQQKRYLLIVFLILGPLSLITQAQMKQDYFDANQLFRQQNYKDAYQIFEQLHKQNPNNFTFLEKATECLINLKEYEKAITLIKKSEKNNTHKPEALIQLGEIYHVSGDSSTAISLWNETLEKYAQDRQVYLRLARTMKERRAYDQAIETFSKMVDIFSSSSVITSELADTYLLAGQYENAIRHFLQLVVEEPNQINYIQNRLVRFQDEQIYKIAVKEISDFLKDLPFTHPAYQSLQQLEVWLLMERNMFQEALIAAKNYEQKSSKTTFLLYSLANRLKAVQQYELAENAYLYYINNDVNANKYRSMEELASVYREWAQYLEQYNLMFSSRTQGLFNKAFKTLNTLRAEASNYARMDKVLIALSEISLDILHQPDKAKQYLKDISQLSDVKLSDSSLTAYKQYIEGRLLLYEEDYNQARVAFSKSNNHKNSGSLNQKTRYYLALTDFYAGDYEFAQIQLDALERQNTSYYANDAAQLRLQIQRGIQADSTGEVIQPFSRALEYFSQGNHQLGINELKPLLESRYSHPLADEALLEMSKHSTPRNAPFIYKSLSNYLASYGNSSPLFERLLWERARLADQLIKDGIGSSDFPQLKQDSTSAKNKNIIPENVDQVIPLYEEILLHFPDGFYASYVRDQIQKLQNSGN